MKFGKEFRNHLEQTLPEWREKFLRYKPLKKLLKQISVTDEAAGVVLDHDDDDRYSSNACRTLPPAVTVGGSGFCYPAREVQGENMPWVRLEERFVMILDEEVDKFNDFYMDKEEEFVIRLQELKERIEAVKGTSSRSWIFSCESKFSEEMLDIRKEFVRIHGEMVLLKNYSSLNFAGLVKILKKYDKRTGALLRLPFTQHALHQPFFTTEPLTRLVHECEANLELLFPLEAEVVESNAPNETETSTPEASSSSLREEDTMDMRRSVLAAMAAIDGLRGASSTYNRLSMAYFFQGHDEDDGAGTVTSENSVSNTPVILQNEENDGEDVLSSK